MLLEKEFSNVTLISEKEKHIFTIASTTLKALFLYNIVISKKHRITLIDFGKKPLYSLCIYQYMLKFRMTFTLSSHSNSIYFLNIVLLLNLLPAVHFKMS